MKSLDQNDHFIKFPYKKEIRENGDMNNGGFDLIKSPERISEIHELEGAPWLYNFIEKTNSKDGHFMTFGCVYGRNEDNGMMYGYVDFSFRPDAPLALRKDVGLLEGMFYQYLLEAMVSAGEKNPYQAIEYAKNCFVWEHTPLEIYEQIYSKLTVVFRAPNDDVADWSLGHLEYFLNVAYPKLPHVRN
ncbi:hypothetical protein QHC71_002346 [Serratia marcescens]|uniref:hypothetical protein n=1 Tax=Serratia sp. SM29 TaxID=3162877 RepID=UPI002901FF43|nr:hypothetical protein [Serratia marcescens]MDU1393742.1 hypothetical protein [Serratia marcescens]HEJ7228374.1 hypothetical protein [Serratia marcescens]HEJ7254940.1 hypothetical protein [Serratia marcescens]HEJ8092393.1 hypothetical protein [Serratia marcescens]